MATRPKSTRSRPPPISSSSSSSMPPPAPRPRSVLTKSNSSQRPGLATPVDESHEPHARPTKSNQDIEANIQVVIRCRRRSDREIQDASPIIVQIDGAKSHDITIESAAPLSSLGVVTLPPTRKYPFDLVFGPEADQSLVYHQVVSPMLEEVLRGYNCTLFAYGQTGTGKTHTMQGDLTPTPMGNPSNQAGMIPRVLFRLFHQLESSNSDYSVKISFVELYNEELRDLLAPEMSAPSGSTQPMAQGMAKDNNGLKIFDDSSKKGVFIQGLEESPVKDCTDALALLTKGSQRRQIAATKFNDHSSRSHSVFSITVHVKETSQMGDDLLKVGKLHLVDLAGSENIGRSGAENKRAREAGMINQSLLTLGRVINALVDKSPHVPYRESKLTRLLQDSLGGRTKTCIIATISPARCNMDETLSTLDYAIRAKSIRNKPEINQRMTRNSLLKEYVAEIERLKSDVLAAREKNGIFFSEENWNKVNIEHELKVSEAEEAKKQVEIVEGQLRAVREEFEQSIALLMKTDGELKNAKQKLQNREEEIVVKDGQLTAVQGALEEEVVVRQAHQETENRLDEVASKLKEVAYSSINDLSLMFDKLERKSSVLSSNSRAVTIHSKSILTELQNLTTKLASYVQVSNQHAQKITTEIDQWQARELEHLSAHSHEIKGQISKIMSSLQLVNRHEGISSDAVEDIQLVIKDAVDSIGNGYNSWMGEMKKNSEKICEKAETASISGSLSAEEAFKSVASLLETIVRESHEYVQTERKSLLEAKALSDSATSTEIVRLREQNVLLVKLLESEKQKSEKAKDVLIARISSLLGEFTAERDKSLKETFGQMRDQNVIGEGEMEKCGRENGEHIVGVIRAGEDWTGSLIRKGAEGKRLRDGAIKALSFSQATFKRGLSDVHANVIGSASGYGRELQKQTQTLDTTCNDALETLASAKRARLDTTNTMATEAQSGYNHLQHGIASTSKNIQTIAGRVNSESIAISSATQSYQTSASTHLTSVRRLTESLVESGTREDAQTGTTPCKRTRDFVDEWELTKSRETLLKEWRKSGISSKGSETFLATHLPLPDEDEEKLHQDEDEMVEVETAPSPSPSIVDGHMDPPSLSSSTSSTDTIPIPQPMIPPIKKHVGLGGGNVKTGVHTIGTLTDSRATNVPPRRRLRG